MRLSSRLKHDEPNRRLATSFLEIFEICKSSLRLVGESQKKKMMGPHEESCEVFSRVRH